MIGIELRCGRAAPLVGVRWLMLCTSRSYILFPTTRHLMMRVTSYSDEHGAEREEIASSIDHRIGIRGGNVELWD